MENKMTIAEQIIAKLSNSFGMTRGELAKSLGRQRDDIRKALNGLIKTGVVHRDTDNNGIEFLTIVKENPAPVEQDEEAGFEKEKQILEAEATAQEARLEEEPAWLMQAIREKDSEAAYAQGFTEGFKEGSDKAQREAYAAGRKSVFDQIRNLLGGIER